MFTGKMNVIVSKTGRTLNVIKNIYNGKLVGKCYLPVELPETIKVKPDCETKLDVKESYLHCRWNKEKKFNELVLQVVEAEVISEYQFNKETAEESAE